MSGRSWTRARELPIGTRGVSIMSTATASHADIKDMTFERALKELETIVSRLERGDVELEESILIYERGEALKEHCDRLLKQAEAKVEKLTFGADGTPQGTQPLDPKA
jgi:exodeoxyribonuclease VII small subunit